MPNYFLPNQIHIIKCIRYDIDKMNVIFVFFLTYDTDLGVEHAALLGHEDSVWDLAYSSPLKCLASCSADGTVRIWDAESSMHCITVFNKEKGVCVIPATYLSNTYMYLNRKHHEECKTIQMTCMSHA